MKLNSLKKVIIVLTAITLAYSSLYLSIRNFVSIKGMTAMEIGDSKIVKFDFETIDSYVHYGLFQGWRNKSGELFKNSPELVSLNKHEAFVYKSSFDHTLLKIFKPAFLVELKIKDIRTSSYIPLDENHSIKSPSIPFE